MPSSWRLTDNDFIKPEAADYAEFENYVRSDLVHEIKNSGVPETSYALCLDLYHVKNSNGVKQPAIVVSCRDKEICTQATRAVRGCEVLQRHKSFRHARVFSRPNPPELLGEMLPLGFDVEEMNPTFGRSSTDSCPYLHILHTAPRRAVVLGRRIKAVHLNGECSWATAGPVLRLNNELFQLTTRHFFNQIEMVADTTADSDEWDDDSVGSFDSLEELNETHDLEVDVTSTGSNTSPETSSVSSTTGHTLAANQIETIRTNTSPEPEEKIDIGSDSLENPERLPTITPEPNYIVPPSSLLFWNTATADYLLYPLGSTLSKSDTEDQIEAGPAGPHWHEHRGTSPAASHRHVTSRRPVILTTPTLDFVPGTLYPGATMCRMPNSQEWLGLAHVKANINFQKGDSGTAVFDAQTGCLYGHVIFGSPGSSDAYIMPIDHVLQQLEAVFGPGKVDVCSRLTPKPSSDSPFRITPQDVGDSTIRSMREMAIRDLRESVDAPQNPPQTLASQRQIRFRIRNQDGNFHVILANLQLSEEYSRISSRFAELLNLDLIGLPPSQHSTTASGTYGTTNIYAYVKTQLMPLVSHSETVESGLQANVLVSDRLPPGVDMILGHGLVARTSEYRRQQGQLSSAPSLTAASTISEVDQQDLQATRLSSIEGSELLEDPKEIGTDRTADWVNEHQITID